VQHQVVRIFENAELERGGKEAAILVTSWHLPNSTEENQKKISDLLPVWLECQRG
jgi:hypothetical protein